MKVAIANNSHISHISLYITFISIVAKLLGRNDLCLITDLGLSTLIRVQFNDISVSLPKQLFVVLQCLTLVVCHDLVNPYSIADVCLRLECTCLRY